MGLSVRDMFDHLGYTLSLPERLTRFVVAVAGGATKLIADATLPKALRKSRTYNVLVGNAQRFIIEKVAEVEGVYQAEGDRLPDDYVPRKVAGNVLEAAGIFSLHLSPLWVFAIAADVAGGSREYLGRLTAELKRDNVIAPDASIGSVDELLGAIGGASEDSARVFDAPPISTGDITKLRDQLVQGYGQVFSKIGNLMPRIDALWNQMQSLTDTDASLARLAGLMTLDVRKTGGAALNGLFAVGRATSGLLGETILDSYAESLAEVERRGLAACVEEATRPYVKAFWKRYQRANLSWTERVMRWTAEKLGLRTPDAPPPPALPAPAAQLQPTESPPAETR
ncbi:MAG: hypothetical protein HUU22_16995 [Phycisphaerae bacterium]|nr:hypothetical protein [Phycisphaerae bacterium]NUQ47719.1 hypothetical protein [Phycisphaerae bacterium]